MKADKTREILEISYVCEEGIAICESKYYQCKAELDELERLASVGRATEKAFEWQEYCIASYKGNHLRAIKTIEELLAWKESED